MGGLFWYVHNRHHRILGNTLADSISAFTASWQVHLVYTVYKSSSSCSEWFSKFWHILDVMVTVLSYVYIVFVILYVDKLGSFSFSSGKQVSAYMSCFVSLMLYDAVCAVHIRSVVL